MSTTATDIQLPTKDRPRTFITDGLHSTMTAQHNKQRIKCCFEGGDSSTGGEGDSHMKGAGMLVVSLRGVNFGFTHLGCSGKNAIIFSREGLV